MQQRINVSTWTIYSNIKYDFSILSCSSFFHSLDLQLSTYVRAHLFQRLLWNIGQLYLSLHIERCRIKLPTWTESTFSKYWTKRRISNSTLMCHLRKRKNEFLQRKAHLSEITCHYKIVKRICFSYRKDKTLLSLGYAPDCAENISLIFLTTISDDRYRSLNDSL